MSTPNERLARWRSYDLATLNMIESDTNAVGLAAYIDSLRAQVRHLWHAVAPVAEKPCTGGSSCGCLAYCDGCRARNVLALLDMKRPEDVP